MGIGLADDDGKAFPDGAKPDKGSFEYKVWRDRIMGKSISGYDLVMPLGTREMKPKLAPKPQ